MQQNTLDSLLFSLKTMYFRMTWSLFCNGLLRGDIDTQKLFFGHLGPRPRWKVGSFLQMFNVFLLNFDKPYGDLSSARYNKVSYHELDQCIIT